MRRSIRFVRRGEVYELSDFKPSEMLLDHLRLREGALGTKEGCAEGDCGACTVAVGRARDGKLTYLPVNACITPVGAVDGMEVVAVEDLAGPEGALHPIQAAMVEYHGSQCGFCTPGFVMSLFALYHATEGAVERATVNDWLAGNLCRCTGYRPIIDAALAVCSGPRDDRFAAARAETVNRLAGLAHPEDVLVGNKESFFAAPATVASLAVLYDKHPDATLVSGATDVGLWVTKQLRTLRKVIHTGRLADFGRVEDVGEALLFGAGVTFAAAERHLAGIDPDLGELIRRIGAKQVRAAGTIAGNIANGSPIGDTPPALIALGATVELRKGTELRSLALEEFFIEYGKQNRQPGEFITGVLVPKLKPGELFRCYKISKRFDQDISSVMAAFRFTIRSGQVADVHMAFGGMAGIPKRARTAEAALIGTRLGDTARWADAFAALKQDFDPIDDHRASARYRIEAAQALLGKALIETAGTASTRTRLVGHREGAARVGA